jgi:hypothetical protein
MGSETIIELRLSFAQQLVWVLCHGSLRVTVRKACRFSLAGVSKALTMFSHP